MQAYLEKALKDIQENLSSDRPLIGGSFTSEDLTVLYSLADGLYRHGDYAKAKEIFQQLILSKPLDPKHWFGLASVLQMEKQYERALTAWSMTATMSDDAAAHFHAAECLISLGEAAQAEKALEAAEKNASGELKQKIIRLKEVLHGCPTD